MSETTGQPSGRPKTPKTKARLEQLITQVAHVLVWRAAAKLLRRANRNHERVAELERALERAPRTKHRRLTLPIVGVASLAVDVGDEEAAKAVAEYAFTLSTSGRPSRKHHELPGCPAARLPGCPVGRAVGDR